ncbi:MAG: decarboxylase, partial [Acutalibacteraceae bacterium]
MQSILEKLKRYQKLNFTPMHMPGHKRNIDCGDYLGELCASLDITEIDGFDNLHKPQGILAESMKKASELWESHESFFLVGGSTCGILASIRSAVCNGDEIIVARNCHKSVYNAIELLELNAHFVLPTIDEDFGIYGSIAPEQINFALKKFPNSKLVILTSPTYEGIISDIKGIC